jgi:DNA polymerase III alpha subunit
MSKQYENYHNHTYFSNPSTPDSVCGIQDYIDRAIKFGHKTYSTVEHGRSSDIFEAYELCAKSGLKMVFGIEAYIVKNIEEKERGNHIILMALNNKGRRAINKINSRANEIGFYYHPRIQMDWLLELPKDDVVITSACVNTPLDIDGFVELCHEHFQEHFFLEIQNHMPDIQKDLNIRVLALHKKYGIEMMHGNDSHYIFEHGHLGQEGRKTFLHSKGIHYENEDDFMLDYPSYNTILDRYDKQGIFSQEQVEKALENTLIFDKETVDLKLDKEIKMPNIYKDLTPNERLLKLVKLVVDLWNKDKNKIDKSKHHEYVKAIKEELKVIQNTNDLVNTADYFLLNYELFKLGMEKYKGEVTPTGRGCVFSGALVHTKNDLKLIQDIKIGDEVITSDGKFNKVIDTMKYDIEEKMVKVTHLYGTNKYHPTLFTLDHKILINRDNKVDWIEAQYIEKGDYL